MSFFRSFLPWLDLHEGGIEVASFAVVVVPVVSVGEEDVADGGRCLVGAEEFDEGAFFEEAHEGGGAVGVGVVSLEVEVEDVLEAEGGRVASGPRLEFDDVDVSSAEFLEGGDEGAGFVRDGEDHGGFGRGHGVEGLAFSEDEEAGEVELVVLDLARQDGEAVLFRGQLGADGADALEVAFGDLPRGARGVGAGLDFEAVTFDVAFALRQGLGVGSDDRDLRHHRQRRRVLRARQREEAMVDSQHSFAVDP
mmetsp:Transcript_32136/g.102479  ORF Transcript_32136/g.102479 Transcript_32136/m.102479 type:complete len:251 (+) Transcript_32136:736-1488(+)